MITVISFVVVLGVLIFIHEFGHFIAAKLCGVGVTKFSIGFGPKIWGVKKGQTEYLISGIPLGGYVKMVGEEPDQELSDEEIPLSFTHKNVWKRFIIVACGPVFNLFLAVFIYIFLYWVNGIYYYPPIIGNVEKNSPAFQSGIETGDIIVSVNGEKIISWSDLDEVVSSSKGKALKVIVDHGGSYKEKVLKPLLQESRDSFGDLVQKYEIGVIPYIPPVVGNVMNNSPAQRAGLKTGDIIVGISGKKIITWNDLSKIISLSKGELVFSIKRSGEILTRKILPEKREYKTPLGKTIKKHVIGIAGSDISKHLKIGLIRSVSESLDQVGKIVKLTYIGIYKIFTGSVSADNIGGPVLIAQMAGAQAKQGMAAFFSFMALISINLGLLNLFPIPVLDGGHLMFFVIEAMTGKPVNMKIRGIAQQIGVFLLMMLMVFAFYNDILRLVSG